MPPSTPDAHANADERSPRQHSLDNHMADVYDELRDIARRQLSVRAGGGTLTTTGLVHEAYLRIATRSGAPWNDRGHFLALASLAMRHVLVDRARARFRLKREGVRQQVTFDDDLVPAADQPEVLIRLSDALDELAADEPRLAKVIDCRFFGGMSEEEIAEALGVTTRTVQRDSAKARMLLRRALEE